jgi:pyruvate/2-oxoglutarate dehydrogenase complex dihydrolipoamide acyltransferase (E2) component
MNWMPDNETMTAGHTSGTVEVTMPATGADSRVALTAWLKHPGDRVSEGEAICVVELATGSAEVGSPAAGVLRMVTAAAGQTVPVGAALAVIDVGVAAATTEALDSARPWG